MQALPQRERVLGHAMMSLYFQTPRAQAMNIPSTVQDGESPAEPSLYNLIYCSLAVPNIETGQVENKGLWCLAAASFFNGWKAPKPASKN
jgi:hypothetical protein